MHSMHIRLLLSTGSAHLLAFIQSHSPVLSCPYTPVPSKATIMDIGGVHAVKHPTARDACQPSTTSNYLHRHSPDSLRIAINTYTHGRERQSQGQGRLQTRTGLSHAASTVHLAHEIIHRRRPIMIQLGDGVTAHVSFGGRRGWRRWERDAGQRLRRLGDGAIGEEGHETKSSFGRVGQLDISSVFGRISRRIAMATR